MNASASGENLRLRLFVAGNAPNSQQARENLLTVLDAALVHDAEIEIIDCLAEPLRALEEGIFVTPTLVKLAPHPREIVVGALTNLDRIRRVLSLDRDPSLASVENA